MKAERKFEISGVIVTDPENGCTKSGKPVSKATIAVTENYTTFNGEDRSTTNYFEVSAYGGDALQTLSRAQRGQDVTVIGRITSREKLGRDGGKFYNLYLNASEVILDGPEPASNTASVNIESDDLPF